MSLPTARMLARRLRAVMHPSRTGECEETKLLMAKLLIAQRRAHAAPERLRDAEFKVFSQFGDDGIIQHVLDAVRPEVDTFIELGVQDYSESNTRFLLLNDNWRGLVVDCDRDCVDAIRAQEYYWRHDITAAHAFIQRDNVNDVIRANGFSGPIGLLSIDIDGNDYWVWESLDSVLPEVVVIEFNSVFGPSRAVTIPYVPGFVRERAHGSCLYWGASIKALCTLAARKGYAFVGSNSAGNNAYFVRRHRLGPLRALTAEEGYVESRFRESRDKQGRLSYVAGSARLKLMTTMPLFDVESGLTIEVGDL